MVHGRSGMKQVVAWQRFKLLQETLVSRI